MALSNVISVLILCTHNQPTEVHVYLGTRLYEHTTVSNQNNSAPPGMITESALLEALFARFAAATDWIIRFRLILLRGPTIRGPTTWMMSGIRDTLINYVKGAPKRFLRIIAETMPVHDLTKGDNLNKDGFSGHQFNNIGIGPFCVGESSIDRLRIIFPLTFDLMRKESFEFLLHGLIRYPKSFDSSPDPPPLPPNDNVFWSDAMFN
jgi:hypothetical protein